MDDIQKALDFSNQLDERLTTNFTSPTTSSEDADLLTFAQNLASSDFSRESRIKQSLYARLNAKRSRSSQPAHWQRRLVTAALSIALLISVIFTVPPISTFAQELIKRLQSITLTNAPSLFEPYLTATPTLDPNYPPTEVLNLSLDEAIAKAGFTPLIPTYLPEGYVLTRRDARIGQITSEFEPAGIDTSKCCVVFSIMQLWSPASKTHSTYQYPVGNVPIVDVLVRNVNGLWVQNAEIGLNKDAEGNPQIMPGNLLTWEEDDSLFWMTSFDARTNIPLSKEEMMKVANSLQLPAK